MNFFTGRFAILCVGVGGMAYVYYLVMKLPKGVARLIALLPLLPFFVLVPWNAETACERALIAFLFTWMACFKLVLVAYDAGPAKDPLVLSSFFRFFCAMSLTLHIDCEPPRTQTSGNENSGDSTARRKGESSARSGLVKRKPGAGDTSAGEEKTKMEMEKEKEKNEGKSNWLVVLATSMDWRIVLIRCVVYAVLTDSWLRVCMAHDNMPVLVQSFNYCILLYLDVLFTFELPAALCVAILGVKMPAQFNMPILADSLGDFWGKRWNLLVNNLLRVAIYNPILKALSRSGKKPPDGVRALATLTSFLVSGLMHDVLFFYMNKRPPTFEVTLCFLINGAATVLETFLKHRNIYLPRIVRRVYTLSFVFLCTSWLFYPPIIRTGMVRQYMIDVTKILGWIKQNLMFY